ncbi:formate--tetrahydrofolate ligase, partial [Apibacter sp.]
MKSDIEIARSIKLKPISEVAENLSIPLNELIPYGNYIAKIPQDQKSEDKVKKSNLIL